MRHRTPVEVLKLSKEDFNAGFGDYGDGRVAGRDAEAEDRALRSRLLGFIQMVSRKQRLSLAEDRNAYACPAPTATLTRARALAVVTYTCRPGLWQSTRVDVQTGARRRPQRVRI